MTENNVSDTPVSTNAQKKTSVSAIIGLVLGIIALILSWVPIINNLAAVFGFIAFIFSIVAVWTTFKSKKKSGGKLAIAALVVSILSFAIVIGTQAMYGKAIDDAVNETTGVSSSQAAKVKNTDQDTEGDLKSAHVKIVSAVKGANDYENKPTVLVTFDWTNKTTKNTSAMVALSYKAFQNGKSLDQAVYSQDPEGYDSNSTYTELQPNANGTVTVGYVLEDESPVTVEISDLFSTGKAKVVHKFTL
ncbi:MAG: DUF5067 domain-containing protein [Bifidobacteriaceae bacterium]|nr:DUF5067 domain-containing protein [Bifidobacteriaceae bacterium]